MTNHDLEAKVDSERLRKEVLRQFSYFGAVVNKYTESDSNNHNVVFNAKVALPYVMYACDKASEKASGILKYYLKGIKIGAMYGDSHTIEAYAKIFEEEFTNAKYSDICSLVKEKGYKGMLPKFMEEYTNESIISLNGKYKRNLKTKKMKIVLKVYDILRNTLYRKIDEGFADYMTELQFSKMNEEYKNKNKKGRKKQAK